VRIGVLECDHVDERYVDIDGDYLDMFRRLLATVAPASELIGYDAIDGKLPSSPVECDGWLITGSRFSVDDDEPWIAPLSAFVRDVRAAETPLVGICFGHQLLAHSLGGRTERAPTGWGVGTHEVELTEGTARGWIDPTTRGARLLFMHQDQVTAVPPDGVTLARTAHCPIAVLQVGRTMLGIQAHPEFSPEYVDALLVDRRERIGAERTDAARQSLRVPTDGPTVARWIAAFLDAV
jgi:GMP synthase-like glutamine amidotransferase